MRMKRKLLSVVLTLAMVAASLRFGTIDAYAASTWYASGTGTETDPYIVKYLTNLNGLATAVENSSDGLAGVYIKLADDLSGNQFGGSIGTKAKPFKGHFDGNRKSLYLNYNPSVTITTEKAYGLFGALGDGAVVENVSTYGSIQVSSNADNIWCGGIAGYVANATVRNCSSTVTVTVGSWINAYAGGLVGELATGGKVYNCYAKSTVSADVSPEGVNKAAGGLVGYLNGGEALNGYADGTLICTGHKGGVIGWKASGTAKNVFCKTANESYGIFGSTTSVTEAWMKASAGTIGGALVETLNAGANGTEGKERQYRMWSADGTNFPEFGQMEIAISFDENGGSGTMGDVNVTAYTYNGAKAVLPACTFEAPAGKVFAGWAIGSAASSDVKLAGETHTFTKATTLYATWDTPFYVQLPVYNVAGDPTSGIKEWQQVSLSKRTAITDGDTAWGEDGKSSVYVADKDVTINNSVEVKGNVTLVLCDGVEVIVDASAVDNNAGIRVTGDNKLTICVQGDGTGTLHATAGEDGAGIGGSDGETGGNITINGGTIHAAVAEGGFGAGIGGGDSENGSNITINGGTVYADGDKYGAGIGGGDGGDGSNITINGGTVTATGGTDGAGIGGGDGGNGSNITINGGNIKAIGKSDAAGIGGGHNKSGTGITITGGEVEATSEGDGAGIGGGKRGSGSDITIKGGTVLAVSKFKGAGIGGGYGKIELISASDETKLVTSVPQAAEGKNITIEDGEVAAASIHGGAGIGGGAYGAGKNITVKGGSVNALGGDLEIQDTDDLDEDTDTTEYIFICGSGIGGGAVATGENIRFEGGSVNTKGGIPGEGDMAGDGIGNGTYATGSKDVYVATALDLLDGATEEPIAHTGSEDVAAKVLGLNNVLVKAPVIHTVIFDLDGKGNDFTQQVASGSCAVRPANPTYRGWTFKGWYKDLANDIAWIFKGEEGAEEFKITEDTTIYAKWEKNSDPSPEPEPEKPEEKQEEPDPVPEKTGSAGDPVTDGVWNMGPGGVWTYRTNGTFRNTWGYILNPYATDESNRYGWFWFDKGGAMVTGWVQIDGKWYYLNEDPSRGCRGMLLVNTTTPDGYRVGADGAWIQ